MLGARRAGTGMYPGVHEDCEHCATTQTGAAVVFHQQTGEDTRLLPLRKQVQHPIQTNVVEAIPGMGTQPRLSTICDSCARSVEHRTIVSAIAQRDNLLSALDVQHGGYLTKFICFSAGI